jgi:hypothetical protein
MAMRPATIASRTRILGRSERGTGGRCWRHAGCSDLGLDTTLDQLARPDRREAVRLSDRALVLVANRLSGRPDSCDAAGGRYIARGVAPMPVRIFLSTVSDEFRDYRDQLRHDLTRHNVEVKVQEDFKDYGRRHARQAAATFPIPNGKAWLAFYTASCWSSPRQPTPRRADRNTHQPMPRAPRSKSISHGSPPSSAIRAAPRSAEASERSNRVVLSHHSGHELFGVAKP